MSTFYIIVNSAFGIEAVTKRELQELGIPDTQAFDGRISFKGDWQTICELNINLRTADRVMLKIAEFDALTFDELFDNTFNSPFENFLNIHSRILVNAKSVKSGLFALSSIQKIVKKAIIERLKKAYRAEEIPEDGEDYGIEVSINRDKVIIALDTTGVGLHKRGYRDKVWVAPLKETIAAAIVKLSVWNKDKTLIDPFCGSGTIPIEAALIGKNIAPGINRDFAFMAWNYAPQEYIKLAHEKAHDLVRKDTELDIKGYDIDKKAIDLARRHAERAGVDIILENKDMRECTSDSPFGVIITNPPYGERLLSELQIKHLYRDLFAMYKSLPNYSMYLLTACENTEQYFNRKADKNRKLYNGNIECRLYSYMGKKPN